MKLKSIKERKEMSVNIKVRVMVTRVSVIVIPGLEMVVLLLGSVLRALCVLARVILILTLPGRHEF